MKKFPLILSALCCLILAGCGDDSDSGKEKTNPDPEHQIVCGDNVTEGDEQCDDGNTISGDGCSSTCTLEEDDNPPDDTDPKDPKDPKDPPVDPPKTNPCGNHSLDSGEVCDDGNTEDGDGCSSDCKTIEEGYRCDDDGLTCAPKTCGDGFIDNGEDCDEGDASVDYGIHGDCTDMCKAAHYCGDGLLDDIDIQNDEECDNGPNNVAADSTDYNACTIFCKRINFCGDGVVTDDEKCDDGNTDDNDGCSSKCDYETGFKCATTAGKTTCSPIDCGNGKLDTDKGELCDDGNRVAGDGCSAACQPEKGWRCTLNNDNSTTCVNTCGDGVIDLDTNERCDDGNTTDKDGCSATCQVETGYVCEESQPDDAGKTHSVCYARACGDGFIAGNEECDDGNAISGDGCSKFCKREKGWHCTDAGTPCSRDMCGDGMVTGDETCDTGSADSTGCVGCLIQPGYKCEKPGEACSETVCGDGKMEGAETCEEENECCVQCAIQNHCLCDSEGKNCQKGECGNGILEYGEACDDGNKASGDGCSEACTKEPIFECLNGVCKPTCGDGLAMTSNGEECDDGNLINGDGCSSQCKIEKGFTCVSPDPAQTPDTINLAVTYRDVIRWQNTAHQVPASTTPMTDGYVSQELYDSLPDSCKGNGSIYRGSMTAANYTALTVGRPNPDFTSECDNGWCKDVVLKELGPEEVPVLGPPELFKNQTQFSAHVRDCKRLYTCPEVFRWWFMDVPGLNRTIKKTLPLKKSGDAYGYKNDNYYPLTATEGYGKAGSNNSLNGEFSSVSKTYFRYKGGEVLTFNGDDDVWIYFNGILGVELAGIHGKWTETITLDKETGASKFGMYPGGIYPIHIFQAERCTGSSTFQLTLAGFVNMGESTCTTTCGDGIVAGAEQCDIEGHTNDDTAIQEGCVECKFKPYCGNKKIETGEGCDTDEVDAATGSAWCVGCQIQTCGNNALDDHEDCDEIDGKAVFKGKTEAESAGLTCSLCRVVGCGDGIVDDGEECDDGNTVKDDTCSNVCRQPECGDGIIQTWLGEVCDDGINDGAYGHCGLGCAYHAPKCGDGVVDALNGEQCDDGENSGAYGTCNPDCTLGERCGDGTVQTGLEDCDEGENNGKGACATDCTFSIN